MPQSRYIRQETLPQVGKIGQAALARARIAIVGLGALGSVSSDILTRSGVGYLRLIDHDHVELSNLQRCALYTEADVKDSAPKALAAAEHLAGINSTTVLEPHVCRIDSTNVLRLLADVDLILDGSDNFELREIVNEAANKLQIPWIYTGVLGTVGMLMSVVPSGPCFRCLSPAVPAPGSYPTCMTNGVLASTTRIAATLESTLAMKLLLEEILSPSETSHTNDQNTADVAGSVGFGVDGDGDTTDGSAGTAGGVSSRGSGAGGVSGRGGAAGGGVNNGESVEGVLPTATLLQFDVWKAEFENITVEKNPDCPVCGHHQYALLECLESGV